MRKNRRVASGLKSIIALGLVASLAWQWPAMADDDTQNVFSRQVLAEHNLERTRAGVPALVWNEGLAREAQTWAHKLAREGWLRHASDSENGGAGENLWMGSAGYFAPEAMIGTFIEERRFFKPGAFPDVSQTGNWQDVGHYTQVVWRDTREVGCAVARNARDDFLVCRYWPAGNWMGEQAY